MPCSLQRRHVLGHVAPRQQAAVHLRVQRLHAAVEHLGEAGVVGHLGDRQAGIGQQLGGAAGGQQRMPSACRPRANSRMPVLSETERSAFMGKGLPWSYFKSLCSTSFLRSVLRFRPSHSAALRLVAFGLGHHDVEQRLLDHRTSISYMPSGSVPRRSRKVPLQAVAHAVLDLFLAHASCSSAGSSCSSSASCCAGMRSMHGREPVEVVADRAQLLAAVLDARSCARGTPPPRAARARTSRCACARCARRELAVQRVVVLEVRRAASGAPRPPAAAPGACPSPGNARSRGRSTAGPAPRGRSSPRRHPVAASTSRAFSGESMSPLATTGMRTAAFTAAMVSYSAWPL
jgi:hypothetical protein